MMMGLFHWARAHNAPPQHVAHRADSGSGHVCGRLTKGLAEAKVCHLGHERHPVALTAAQEGRGGGARQGGGGGAGLRPRREGGSGEAAHRA